MAMFGGFEIVLILAIALLLFGSRRIPQIARGLRRGHDEFKRAIRDINDEMPFNAGKSLGGIYGKRAAQALTPENRVGELYNPAAFQDGDQHRKLKLNPRRLLNFFWSFFHRILMRMRSGKRSTGA